jgi:hypothetical protein
MATSTARTDGSTIESLVVADLGRGSSRAILLEQAGGAVRFVAKSEGPTTAAPPIDDVTVGWLQLLRNLEWETGQRLTERDELVTPQRPRGDGTDAMLICSTLGEPVRVALLEAGTSPVSAPLLEAMKRTYSRLFHVVAPTSRKDTGWAAAQTEALRGFRPEFAIILCGADQGGTIPRIMQIARQLGALGTLSQALVIADGQSQEAALTALGVRAKVRSISPASKPAPEVAAEVEHALLEAYYAHLNTPDFAELLREASGGVVVRAHAVDLVNRFVARAFSRHVVTLDMDDGAHVHWASGSTGALATLPQLDLGPNITNLTTREVADAARWLPFPATEDELVTWVLNRAIRPWSIATDPRDLLIEQALTRQVLRRAVAEIARAHPLALPGADLVIGGRSLARWGQPGAAALTLLDSLDVVPNHGVLDLALDQDGLMAVAGTLATINHGLASDVFEYDGLIHLGSAVVIGGQPHEGELACRGEIHYESGEMATFSVASGQIEVLPLRTGETASLVLRPERRFSIGGHPTGKSVTLSEERRIIGGSVGVILDARGRSLAAGPIPQNRQARVKQWIDAANGVTQSIVRRSDPK